MERITIEQAESLLMQMIEFNAGNLVGKHSTNHLGMMTGFYEVWSYGTVIAICNLSTGFRTLNEGAYNHSKTTSKHANIVKRMWGLE
jgi:hypothetical protein